MKFLLLLALVAVAYLLWRNSRLRGQGPKQPQKPAASGEPQDMVRCPVCSVHLPRADAVTGANGLLYCSQEHRLRAGE
jgi:uncharacterized protein